MHLDNFIGLFRLADKKKQETLQTYCTDKQKINSTEIYDDCITTKRPAGNTRLSGNSRIRAILEFHHPQYLHRSATVKAPAIRLLRLVSVVMCYFKKRTDNQIDEKRIYFEIKDKQV